jgi:hypothetical protein
MDVSLRSCSISFRNLQIDLGRSGEQTCSDCDVFFLLEISVMPFVLGHPLLESSSHLIFRQRKKNQKRRREKGQPSLSPHRSHDN